MFDKDTMKLVNFDKAKKELMKGNQVYMVAITGTLTEITESTDWQALLFHNLKGGSYAVCKKSKSIGFGNFTKNLHIGQWNFEVSHKKKGGDA